MKTYFDFNEINDEVIAMAPLLVYKYRTCESDIQKSLLLESSAWFSHPFDLNDPLDVRPEHKFDLSEVHHQKYFEKLLSSADEMFPQLSPPQRRAEAERKWEETKKNPTHILTAHHEIQHSRDRHNPYGVFSTSINGLSPLLWKEYASNGTGYNLGFKTVELCREIECSFGLVKYSEEPYQFSFLREKDIDNLLFMKKTKWEDEEEFRFLTGGIGIIRGRLFKFSPDVVGEVILGENMLPQDEATIIGKTKELYPMASIYKAYSDETGKLNKTQL